MKNRQPAMSDAPQSVAHKPLKSAATVSMLLEQYTANRATADDAGRRAVDLRQQSENHLRTAQARQDRAEELERELNAVRAEVKHYAQLGRDGATQADVAAAEQRQAEQVVDDLEHLLTAYAPAALANAQAPSAPTNGVAPTDALVASNGSGPHPIPNASTPQEQ